MNLRKMTDAQIWQAWKRHNDAAAMCKAELDYKAELERRARSKKRKTQGYWKANVYSFPSRRR